MYISDDFRLGVGPLGVGTLPYKLKIPYQNTAKPPYEELESRNAELESRNADLIARAKHIVGYHAMIIFPQKLAAEIKKHDKKHELRVERDETFMMGQMESEQRATDLNQKLNAEIADLNQKVKTVSIRAEAAEKCAEAASKSCDKDSGDGKSSCVRKVRTEAFLIDSHFNMTAGSSDNHKPEDDGDTECEENLKPAAKKPKVSCKWISDDISQPYKTQTGKCACGLWPAKAGMALKKNGYKKHFEG